MKLMLPASGAELMIIYPSIWALQLNHSGFLSLHDAETALVTGIADLPFDLPKKIGDAVNIELEVLQSADIARYTQEHQQKQMLEIIQATTQLGFMRSLFAMQDNLTNPPDQNM